jgi:hypothetical protein
MYLYASCVFQNGNIFILIIIVFPKKKIVLKHFIIQSLIRSRYENIARTIVFNDGLISHLKT